MRDTPLANCSTARPFETVGNRPRPCTVKETTLYFSGDIAVVLAQDIANSTHSLPIESHAVSEYSALTILESVEDFGQWQQTSIHH